MQKKWIVGILAAATLSWVAAGVVIAAPSSNSSTRGDASQVVAAPMPPFANDFSFAPLMTGTITVTVTPTATLSPGNQKIAQAIADYFDVDVEEVEEIHEQAHGWGQVFLVFMLADKTGEEPQDIWAKREDGEGWGKIFSELGIKHGLRGNNLGAAVSGLGTPAAPAQGNTFDEDDKKCKGNPNSNGKGNPCPNPNATPPSSNSNQNGNGNGNNNKGKGNSKGK